MTVGKMTNILTQTVYLDVASNIEHDLDLEEVSKIFAIGGYEHLRDEEDEQVEAS